MQVNLSIEMEEQKRRKLRPRHARLTIFDELVALEFLADDERRLRQDKALPNILRFSATQMSHYRTLFERLGLKDNSTPQSSDLLRIPPLSKITIQEKKAALIADRLPLKN